MKHIGVRKKSSITTWNRWKKEGNSKVSKKNNSTIVVCVCGVWYTGRVQGTNGVGAAN